MIVELPGDLIRPVVHLDFRHALHLDFRGLTKDLPTTDAGFCDAAVDWSVLNSTQLECFSPYCALCGMCLVCSVCSVCLVCFVKS